MKPSAEFLSGLPDAELLNYCEGEIEEFVTSNTELALISKFREFVDGEDGSMPVAKVKDILLDIKAQLPNEDFGSELLQDLASIAKAKNLTKAEIIDGIKEISNQLDSLFQNQFNATEFALEIINDIVNPKPRGK